MTKAAGATSTALAPAPAGQALSSRKSKANGQHPPVPADPVLAAILEATRDPAFDVGKLQALVAMRRQSEHDAAERAFNQAMAACQAELVPVARNQTNEQTNSRYADLAALAEKALPVVHRHGFGLTFGETDTVKPSCIGVGVRIAHRDGRAERLQFHVPVDMAGFKGTPNKTAIHGYGSALTYCRRYALLCAFNIVVAGDDDGNAAGRPKSAYRARRENDYPRIERRVRRARSIEELAAVWAEEEPIIRAWPEKWRQHIVLEKENRKAVLTGTMDALEASLAYLDDHA